MWKKLRNSPLIFIKGCYSDILHSSLPTCEKIPGLSIVTNHTMNRQMPRAHCASKAPFCCWPAGWEDLLSIWCYYWTFPSHLWAQRLHFATPMGPLTLLSHLTEWTLKIESGENLGAALNNDLQFVLIMSDHARQRPDQMSYFQLSISLLGLSSHGNDYVGLDWQKKMHKITAVGIKGGSIRRRKFS